MVENPVCVIILHRYFTTTEVFMELGKRPLHPTLIPIVSLPHFILGGLLAAFNWRRLGYPVKASNTIKWSIFGTIAIIIIALYLTPDTLKKMWPVGLGVNLGVGMALRTLQLPEYDRMRAKYGK